MSVEIDPKLCFGLMPMGDEFIELCEDVFKPTVMEDISDRMERAKVMQEQKG